MRERRDLIGNEQAVQAAEPLLDCLATEPEIGAKALEAWDFARM